MVDVLFVPRKRWRRAHWRIVGKRRARSRLLPIQPGRLAQRVLSRASRTWGLVALAVLGAGAVLLNLGYLKDAGGSRVTERFSVTAVDGDSLRLANENIRLLGIDAPELSQTCRDERGREWACGQEARALLRSLVSRGTVNCASISKDHYGRTLATCSAGPIADIGEAMVRAGFAVDFMSGGYRAAEAEARADKRGIWQGSFERPQDWRRQNRRTTG